MRYLRTIERPAPSLVLQATCGFTQHLGLNEEVHLVHAGEDGVQALLHTTREFNLVSQEIGLLGHFQDWFADEVIAQIELEHNLS